MILCGCEEGELGGVIKERPCGFAVCSFVEEGFRGIGFVTAAAEVSEEAVAKLDEQRRSSPV